MGAVLGCDSKTGGSSWGIYRYNIGGHIPRSRSDTAGYPQTYFLYFIFNNPSLQNVLISNTIYQDDTHFTNSAWLSFELYTKTTFTFYEFN